MALFISPALTSLVISLLAITNTVPYNDSVHCCHARCCCTPVIGADDKKAACITAIRMRHQKCCALSVLCVDWVTSSPAPPERETKI